MGIHSLMHNLTVKDAVPASLDVSNIGRKQIMQNRFSHGPNLGAMFVAEKWIDDSIFEGADGDAELAAVEAQVKQSSAKDVRQKFEQRWRDFMTDDDWNYLASKGVTGVRLPIGFWNVGAKYAKGTPFDKYSEVYEGSWQIIKDLIKKADSYDIGVLLDFHALPGGANADAHSGTNSGKAEFWSTSKFRDNAIDMYVFVAQELAGYDNLVGLELVNEAQGSDKLKPFYLDAIKQVRKVNTEVPLIISDAWNLGEWQQIIKGLDSDVSSKLPATVGVVIDTHVYRAFSDQDKAKSAEQHVQEAKDSVPRDDDVDVMVGEYSCVLSEDSWNKCGNRDDLEKQYGCEQTACFGHCARAGAYFWTYKFMQGPGGGWDFRCMVDKGAIPTYSRSVDANKPDINALQGALEQHRNYWNGQDSKQDWEDWRFEDGFKQGFSDAKAFAEFNGSQLGRIAAWKKARLAEHIKAKGASDKTWVYEQAFVQGVDAFNQQL